MILKHSSTGNWLVAGSFAAVSYFYPGLEWMLLVSLVLFLGAWMNAPSLKAVIGGVLLYGFLKAAGSIAWFFNIYPLDWLGVERGIGQIAAIGGYWFLVALVIGIGFMLVFALIWRVIHTPILRAWLFPLWLLCAELVGALLFSLFSLGPGSEPNSYFSFGFSGYALPIPWFIEYATVYGVYGLTLVAGVLVVLIYGFIFDHFKAYGLRLQAVLVLVLVVFAPMIVLKSPEQKNDQRSIIVVETNFPRSFNYKEGAADEKRSIIESAVDEALTHEPAIIVLPEDARYISNFFSPEAALNHLAKKTATPTILIDSARTEISGGRVVTRAYILDTGAMSVSTADKQYLVPHGEFMPYLSQFVLDRFGRAEIANQLETELEFTPGEGFSIRPHPNIGVLFCAESVMPVGVRNITALESVDLVVHPVSHGWFNGATMLERQLDRMLLVQSAWQDVSIISAANQTTSKKYTNTGQVRQTEVLSEGKNYILLKI